MADWQPDIDGIFQALGDPMRRAIVNRLSAGPMSVTKLAEPLAISLTAVGQHLQVLEHHRLVHTEKTGRVRTCRLNSTGFIALEEWLRARRSVWENRFDELEKLLDRE